MVRVCHLSERDTAQVLREANELAKQGCRVLGVAVMSGHGAIRCRLTIVRLTATLWLPDARHLAQFDRLTVNELGRCVWMSLAGVGWIEGYKFWKRQSSNIR